MKMFMLMGLSVICMFSASAQLKTKPTCPDLLIDVVDGKVNNIKPNVPAERVKVLLPCFTSSVTDTAKCGAKVFYKDQDVYFYSDRYYVEIGPKFKGKFTFPVMGTVRNSLFKYLGNPKLKDVSWDAWQTNYGCLILRYDSTNKVNLVQFSTLGTEGINLCE